MINITLGDSTMELAIELAVIVAVIGGLVYLFFKGAASKTIKEEPLPAVEEAPYKVEPSSNTLVVPLMVAPVELAVDPVVAPRKAGPAKLKAVPKTKTTAAPVKGPAKIASKIAAKPPQKSAAKPSPKATTPAAKPKAVKKPNIKIVK